MPFGATRATSCRGGAGRPGAERTPDPTAPGGQRAAYQQWRRDYFDFGALLTRDEQSLATLNAAFGPYYELASSETMPANAPIGGWMVQAMYLSMGQRHDYRNALQRIDAPTLVVHGEADLQPVQASLVYAELIPSAQLSVLPSAGHGPYHTHPEAFAQAVGPFLAAAEPGSEAP